MIRFLAILLRLFFQIFRSKGTILSENALLTKENDILLRRVGRKQVHFNIYDKLFFVVLNRAADIKHRRTLVKPETLLYWQRTLMKRFYVFAIISHKTREIIQFAITENPTREFVRQQLMLFNESRVGRAYLIHDNALMFYIDYLAYNLVSVRTGVEAPNMNSIMERFFRPVRREALDNVLLTGKSQVQRILDEYVAFYNCQRPHQGIQQQIPKPGEPEKTGSAVRKSAVLGGLDHHYYRQAA